MTTTSQVARETAAKFGISLWFAQAVVQVITDCIDNEWSVGEAVDQVSCLPGHPDPRLVESWELVKDAGRRMGYRTRL